MLFAFKICLLFFKLLDEIMTVVTAINESDSWCPSNKLNIEFFVLMKVSNDIYPQTFPHLRKKMMVRNRFFKAKTIFCYQAKD